MRMYHQEVAVDKKERHREEEDIEPADVLSGSTLPACEVFLTLELNGSCRYVIRGSLRY